MKLDQNKKILIVGLGLIGGSYAMSLKRQGYYVTAITKDQKSIDYAMQNGMIDKGAAFVDPDIIGEADITVFALYPHVFLSWIQENQQYLKSGTVITDVTGVKTCIVGKIQDILRKDVEFIPAHPMAGKEVSGVENSDDKIFCQANYIVTPTDKNTSHAIELCKSLGETLGFAKISVLTPEKHDEIIGFVSQLTHCIAISLMTCQRTEHLEDYTGDSFRDLTRIARLNDEMWSELFLLNKTELLSQMDLFMDKFKWNRKLTCIIVFVVCTTLGLPSCLGYGILKEITLFGMDFLTFFDYISNSVLMPIVALFTCIMFGWFVGTKTIEDEVTKNGEAFGRKKVFQIMIKYVAPICLVVILIFYSLAQFGFISY